jgi:hypothetical protein
VNESGFRVSKSGFMIYEARFPDPGFDRIREGLTHFKMIPGLGSLSGSMDVHVPLFSDVYNLGAVSV